MMTVPLHGKKARGRVALVDDEDYDLVMQYRWHVHEVDRGPGRRPDGPYARTAFGPGGRQTFVRMHRLLMPGVKFIDHADGNGLNCQRHNLRPVTRQLNGANGRKQVGATSSSFKGVGWYKAGRKWRAAIYISGRSRHLGYFPGDSNGEIAAARAYDVEALRVWGEFARLNFPH